MIFSIKANPSTIKNVIMSIQRFDSYEEVSVDIYPICFADSSRVAVTTYPKNPPKRELIKFHSGKKAKKLIQRAKKTE